ncbi:MAG: DUF2207 domain-containing protein [Bacteroidales bacterium]|nr:DUF2207 domain-containing protein [Bacteroidales bacterium]
MKRILSLILVLAASCLAAWGADVRSVNIDVRLRTDGSARITEIWDLTPSEGTEWYLVRSNLGDIEICDFSVSDESGNRYVNDGEWDVDRSMRAKKGRCGIVHKGSRGVELCWGIGSYEPHIFTVSYIMTRAVKSMDDYDCLHLQFVSPGMTDAPKSVSLTLGVEGTDISEANARVWAFGYNGTAVFSDGRVLATSSERFRSSSSMILLLRFDKGIFHSPSVREGSFQTVLDRAMDGASFGESEPLDKGELLAIAFCGILLLVLGIVLIIWATRTYRKSILGVPTIKEIDWCRDAPFGGDILKSDYVIRKLEPVREAGATTSAMILRMIDRGALQIHKDARGRVEIAFGDFSKLDSLSQSFRGLYDMMIKASGKDGILQDTEFSHWSGRHAKEVDRWVTSMQDEGQTLMRDGGDIAGLGRFTEQGKAGARSVVGFKKFLKDFTLINERASAEVGMWNDYLVFGALFGIADKVAKELSDIDPRRFCETVYADPYTMRRVVWMSSRLSNSITNASAAARAASAARSGLGGAASFGGGGGFSGGGFGGGAR